MGKIVKVRVKEGWRGQKPDKTWAEEGDTFAIDEDLVSKRWMEVMPAETKPAKGDPKAN